MGQYFLISLKSAEFGIFSQLKVQSNPVNSRNLEKHDISGQKWPEYLVKIMKFVKNDENIIPRCNRLCHVQYAKAIGKLDLDKCLC